DGLQDLPERGALGVAAVQQPRDVLEADVAGLQLLVREDPQPALPRVVVALERVVHLVDAVALRFLAERRLGARRAAAEQDAVLWFHGRSLYRTDAARRSGRWTPQVPD